MLCGGDRQTRGIVHSRLLAKFLIDHLRHEQENVCVQEVV